MPKLSVLILCKNEEDRLARCIESVKWADEILMVDSGSTDNSVPLAHSLGARVLFHPFTNYAEQYNWGIEQVENDWILIVDADEVVSPELSQSIRAALQSDPVPHDVFMIRRDAYFMGRLMRSSAWSNERLPRVFRKGSLHYRSSVHSTIDHDLKMAGSLQGIMMHYTYRSLSDCINKLNLNSQLAAESDHTKGLKISRITILASALWRFFHNLLIRGDVMDGFPGVASSLIAAFYTFVKLCKLWELNHND